MNKIFLIASILLVLAVYSNQTNDSNKTCIRGDNAIRANSEAQDFNNGVR